MSDTPRLELRLRPNRWLGIAFIAVFGLPAAGFVVKYALTGGPALAYAAYTVVLVAAGVVSILSLSKRVILTDQGVRVRNGLGMSTSVRLDFIERVDLERFGSDAKLRIRTRNHELLLAGEPGELEELRDAIRKRTDA